MSDDLTKAAPAVVQQRFVLPCAACGAGAAVSDFMGYGFGPTIMVSGSSDGAGANKVSMPIALNALLTAVAAPDGSPGFAVPMRIPGRMSGDIVTLIGGSAVNPAIRIRVSTCPANSVVSLSMPCCSTLATPLGEVPSADVKIGTALSRIPRFAGVLEILTVCAVIPPDWLILDMLMGWLDMAGVVGVESGTDGVGIESCGARSGRACACRYNAPPRDERTTPAKRSQMEEIL